VFLEQYGIYNRKRGETPCINCLDKDAMSVTFDQNCLYLLFSHTNTRKYEKLPNIIIHASQNITQICLESLTQKFGLVAVQ